MWILLLASAGRESAGTRDTKNGPPSARAGCPEVKPSDDDNPILSNLPSDRHVSAQELRRQLLHLGHELIQHRGLSTRIASASALLTFAQSRTPTPRNQPRAAPDCGAGTPYIRSVPTTTIRTRGRPLSSDALPSGMRRDFHSGLRRSGALCQEAHQTNCALTAIDDYTTSSTGRRLISRRSGSGPLVPREQQLYFRCPECRSDLSLGRRLHLPRLSTGFGISRSRPYSLVKPRKTATLRSPLARSTG